MKLTLKQRLASAEAELSAIKRREQHYVETGRWDEMVPWFDLTANERAMAIEYWS